MVSYYLKVVCDKLKMPNSEHLLKIKQRNIANNAIERVKWNIKNVQSKIRRKQKNKELMRQMENIKMKTLTILIIPLNVNKLNTPIKWQRLFIPICMLSIRNSLKIKDIG